MDPRVTVITLGVKSLEVANQFYQEGLGWKKTTSSNEHISFFQLNSIILALYPRVSLAEDALVSSEGNGFSGVTLAQNVREKHEVDMVLKQAQRAGGKIVKPAQDVFWGGHSGYFADPDGFLWEIAWNPKWKLDPQGNVCL